MKCQIPETEEFSERRLSNAILEYFLGLVTQAMRTIVTGELSTSGIVIRLNHISAFLSWSLSLVQLNLSVLGSLLFSSREYLHCMGSRYRVTCSKESRRFRLHQPLQYPIGRLARRKIEQEYFRLIDICGYHSVLTGA